MTRGWRAKRPCTADTSQLYLLDESREVVSVRGRRRSERDAVRVGDILRRRRQVASLRAAGRFAGVVLGDRVIALMALAAELQGARRDA